MEDSDDDDDLPNLPDAINQWYSADMMALISHMLTQDRMKRPGLNGAMKEVERLIEKQGGSVRHSMTSASGDDHHMDILLGNRGFV